jgi:hypothetical protein
MNFSLLSEADSIESLAKLLAEKIKEKFSPPVPQPETQLKPLKLATLTSHNSWDQFIDFDEEG